MSSVGGENTILPSAIAGALGRALNFQAIRMFWLAQSALRAPAYSVHRLARAQVNQAPLGALELCHLGSLLAGAPRARRFNEITRALCQHHWSPSSPLARLSPEGQLLFVTPLALAPAFPIRYIHESS